MFTQIDIQKFGSFEGFEWKKAVRDKGNNVGTFKRLNVIYGRNYSGKTTLSRVFRSMQEGALPWNHESATFEARGAGFSAKATDLKTHNLDIRVYNRDFVAENLSVLHDHRSGQIKTFAIVGGDNNKIVEELEKAQAALGSTEEKTGARHASKVAIAEANRARIKASTAREAYDDLLRRHAADKIKKDRVIGQPSYNIENIKADIQHLETKGVAALAEEQVSAKRELLRQEPLPKLEPLGAFPSGLFELRHQAQELLFRKVAPSQALEDLLLDSSLQSWVKDGVRHHKGKRSDCAFCRQPLPAALFETLAKHFSKESEELEEALRSCLTRVEAEAERARLPAIATSSVYASERQALTDASADLAEAYSVYTADLSTLTAALSARLSSLFATVEAPIQLFEQAQADVAMAAVSAVLTASIGRTATLVKDKEDARSALRRDNVLAFMNANDLPGKRIRIAELGSKANELGVAENVAKVTETELERRVRSLEAQLKDERKGAERINGLLSHFFGHGGLRLDAVDGTGPATVKFEITRDGKPAFHLSEGECSLVAFCYFMAKLEEPESVGKELVIYIDDPISSLDSNHIFFMFSLIEALIARPDKNADNSNRYRYKQLFISTHNLDFLKYLKTLSAPNDMNGGVERFIVERHGDRSSKLSLMPGYLKAYVTEFNYLFHQIHKCANGAADGDDESYYSFGNNLRKFLEAYLYFKYPAAVGSEESLWRIETFFGKDGPATQIASRLSNELSHLNENFDRSMKPIDIPEIQTIASYVLSKLKDADRPQYDALLKSIGAPLAPA